MSPTHTHYIHTYMFDACCPRNIYGHNRMTTKCWQLYSAALLGVQTTSTITWYPTQLSQCPCWLSQCCPRSPTHPSDLPIYDLSSFMCKSEQIIIKLLSLLPNSPYRMLWMSHANAAQARANYKDNIQIKNKNPPRYHWTYLGAAEIVRSIGRSQKQLQAHLWKWPGG